MTQEDRKYTVMDQHGGQVQRGAGVAVDRFKHGVFERVELDETGKPVVVVVRGNDEWKDEPSVWGLTVTVSDE